MTTYRVLFNGYDSNGHLQLWSTDGSAVDTTLLDPADAQSGGLDPDDLVALPTLTVFAGNNAAGAQVLWSSDGTSAGTQPLTVAGASASGLDPTDITRFGNDALFEGFDSAGNWQLWITDGTGASCAPARWAAACPGATWGCRPITAWRCPAVWCAPIGW
jgi:ELWxxDGT repeat protein